MNKKELIAFAEWNKLSYEEFLSLAVDEIKEKILTNDSEKAEDYECNDPYYDGWGRGVIDSAHILTTYKFGNFIIPT